MAVGLASAVFVSILFLVSPYFEEVECVSRTTTDLPVKTCGKGEYLVKGEGRCFLCFADHFMSDAEHRNEACTLCSTATSGSHQVVLSKCNRESDTKFGCPENRYESWKNDRDFDCYLCTNCAKINKFDGRKCQRNKNTVCCDKPHMVVIGEICTDVSPDPKTDESTLPEGTSPPTINWSVNGSHCVKNSTSKNPSRIEKDNGWKIATVILIFVIVVTIVIVVILAIVILARKRRKLRRAFELEYDFGLIS